MILVLLYAIFLFNFKWIAEGSQCYPNYCHEKILFGNNTEIRCIVDPVLENSDCMTLTFENLGHFPPPGEDFAEIQLTAYIKNDSFQETATAFNLSISDLNIRRLITRYQSIGNENLSECHHIELLKNITNVDVHSNLFISCSLANKTYETSAYRLEYLILTNQYKYSRKLVFIIPNHNFIDPGKDLRSFVPFIYADVSDTSELVLYIQPVPSKFKVKSYRIWLLKNETELIKNVTVKTSEDKHIRHHFQVETGVYYFKVATLHADCNDYGCVNSTSPLISIKHSSHRLIIMIISVIWIPPVIFYALFNAYKVYRKNEKLKRAERKPKCLIVYKPTHTVHINVMIDLAKYLRGCKIHAMIDILDLNESTNKDPTSWYNEMFYKADVILWAASPAPSDGFILSFTETVENQILRLAKDYQTRQSKKFYILQFPYCNVTDLPQEAYSLKLFSLPEELDKLVKGIKNVDYIRFFGVSNKQFIESIKVAKIELAQEHNKEMNKLSEENDLPLLSERLIRADSQGIKETAICVDECDGHFDQMRESAEQQKLLQDD